MNRLFPLIIVLLAFVACGKKDEPAPPAPPAPAVSTAPQEEQTTKAETSQPSRATETPTNGKHVVVKGDTLYSIAKKNGLNDRDLARWNNITDPRRLRVGQELRLTPPAG
jgi:LysM repeat protein